MFFIFLGEMGMEGEYSFKFIRAALLREMDQFLPINKNMTYK